MTDTTPAPRPEPAAEGLAPARVTVLDDPGAPADAERLGAGFRRAALEPLTLALPDREQAAVVVLCRGLASPCAAFVLRRPEREARSAGAAGSKEGQGEGAGTGDARPEDEGAGDVERGAGHDPAELARHLALETSRPVVLAAQAARIRNAAAALAALAGLEAGARDDLSAEPARAAAARRVGLEGRAASIAPVLRAAGLAAEQVVVASAAPAADDAPPPSTDLARKGDVSAVLGRPVTRPAEPVGPDVLLVPDLDPADAEPSAPPAPTGETRSFPAAPFGAPRDERPAGPVRVAWVDDDLDLVLPSLVRAAVDHATGPALLDDAGLAAVARALASLAQQGRLPESDDPRLLVTLAPAIAAAIVETAARERAREGARDGGREGAAAPGPGLPPEPAPSTLDAEALAAYAEALADLRSPLRRALRPALDAARQTPRRLVFANGDDPRVVRAARALADEGLAVPWLLGDLFRLETRAKEQGVSLKGIRVLDPARDKRRAGYAQALTGLAGPGALSLDDAGRRVEEPVVFAALTVAQGEADAVLVTEGRQDGLEGLDLAADLLGRRDDHRHLAGVHLAHVDGRALLITDTAGASDPTSEEVADAGLQAAWLARRLLGRTPRVAFLSFTSAGPTAARHDASVRRQALARDVARARAPDLEVLGPVTFEAALDAATEPDAALVLVVPDRAAGATLVGALRRLAGAEVLGPLAPALARPATLAPRGPATSVEDLVLLGALTCALAGAPHRSATEADDDRADAPARAVRFSTPGATRRLGTATPAPPASRDAASPSEPSAPKPSKTDAPKIDPPKIDPPKTDAPKTDAPRTDAPRTDAPRTDAPRTDAPKVDPPKTGAPRSEAPKADAPKPDVPRRAPPPPLGGLAQKPSDVGLGSRGSRAAPPPRPARPGAGPRPGGE